MADSLVSSIDCNDRVVWLFHFLKHRIFCTSISKSTDNFSLLISSKKKEEQEKMK